MKQDNKNKEVRKKTKTTRSDLLYVTKIKKKFIFQRKIARNFFEI